MIKVLFVLTKEDVGGAQKYVQDLTEHLDRTRFNPEIVTGGRKGIRFLSNTFLPYLLFINDFLAVLFACRIFTQRRPNIIHLNNSKAGVVGALAAGLYNAFFAGSKKVRVVFTAHGWVFNPTNNMGLVRRWIYILLHRLASRFQNVIINVSEFDHKLAIRYRIAPKTKLFTIHNGVDETAIRFLDRRTARRVLLPKSHSVDLSEVWVGSIGRLTHEKSYEDFITAATFVKKPGVRFFVIGSGGEYNSLKKKVEKAGLGDRFFIVRDIAPAAPYLKAFDIFLLSSVKEGLPYTLLEAMAAGLPIITTRVGGMTEIIENHGIVMPPREPQELGRAIDHYLDNPEEAKRLSEIARNYLKENLTLRQMIEKTAALYAKS